MRARGIGRALRTALFAGVATFALAGTVAASPAPIDVRTGQHEGFSRLAVEWPVAAPARVQLQDDVVRIAPVAGAVDTTVLEARLGAVLLSARHDGTTLTLVLRPGFVATQLTGLRPAVLAIDFRRDERRPPPAIAGLQSIRPQRRPLDRILPASGATATAEPPAAPEPPSPLKPPAAAATEETARPAEAADATSKAHHGSDGAPTTTEHAETGTPVPGTEASGVSAADRHRAPTGSLPPLPPPTPATVPAHAGEAPANRPREATTVALPAIPADDSIKGRDQAGLPAGTVQSTAEDGHLAAPQEDARAGSTQLEIAPGTVRVAGDHEQVAFTFATPVAAAAWRRGEHVWLVFATPSAEPVFAGPPPPGLEAVSHEAALVWRWSVSPMASLRVEREAASWRLVSGAPSSVPPAPLVASGPVVRLTDDWLGATLIVRPSLDLVRTESPQRAGSSVALPTLQGSVAHDLHHEEEAAADQARSHEPTALEPVLPRPELGRLLGLDRATLDREAARQRRRELEFSLFAEPSLERRVALARFLIGEAAPFEALAVIAAAGDDELADDRDGHLGALEGAASLLAGRVAAAQTLLPTSAEASEQEAALWEAMVAADVGDWDRCGVAFARSGQLWRSYPMPLRRQVALRAAEAAIRLDAPQVAQAVLHYVEPANTRFDASEHLQLLQARALLAAGETSQAKEQLSALSLPPTDAEVQRQARVVLMRLQLDEGDADVATVRSALEADAVAWTGRAGAAPFWKLLSDVRAMTGDAGGAFDALEQAAPPDEVGSNPDRLALLRAIIAGAPPFDGSLEQSVLLLDEHAHAFAPGPERAAAFRELADRVAAETDALHVADTLYERALEEALPYAVEVDLRLALASLRLRRFVPSTALQVLEPLDPAADERVRALLAEAELMRANGTGAAERPRAPMPAAAPEPPPLDMLDATDRALAETRTLLDGGS